MQTVRTSASELDQDPSHLRAAWRSNLEAEPDAGTPQSSESYLLRKVAIVVGTAVASAAILVAVAPPFVMIKKHSSAPQISWHRVLAWSFLAALLVGILPLVVQPPSLPSFGT